MPFAKIFPKMAKDDKQILGRETFPGNIYISSI